MRRRIGVKAQQARCNRLGREMIEDMKTLDAKNAGAEKFLQRRCAICTQRIKEGERWVDGQGPTVHLRYHTACIVEREEG